MKGSVNMKSNYEVESIEHKRDMDHITERLGMYIGEGIDPRHLFVEALDNSVDEVQDNPDAKIIVEVDTKLNKYTITDTGRGIPVGYTRTNTGEEVLVIELLTRFTNSGGKFGSSEAYKISGGLHGVGMAIISSLSKSSKFTTTRLGIKQGIEFNTDPEKLGEGSLEASELLHYVTTDERVDEEVTQTGTVVEFIPNDDIFQNKTIPIDFLIDKCKICNAQYSGAVVLKVNGEDIDVKSEFKDLVYRPNPNAHHYYETLIEVEDEETGEFMKVWIEYNSDTSYSMSSYANLINTRDGGTHNNAIARAIDRAWEEFFEESSVNLRAGDARVGCYGLLSLAITEPSFASQTKTKLSVDHKRLDKLMDLFSVEFAKWLKSDAEMRKALLMRFEQYRRDKDALSSQKDIASLVKLNTKRADGSVRRKSVVSKLIECTSRSRKDTELILVEGDSAAGPAQRTRNKKLQAVLPLRGKVKNVVGMDIAKALKTAEILDIVNSVGAGVGEDCDVEDSRYERIIVSADADPDGAHIMALLLGALVTITPELVKAGMVYISYAPLYSYMEGKDEIFAWDQTELPKKIWDSGNFTRFKGLGEMEDHQFAVACLNKETRRLVQVQYPDDLAWFNRILGTSQGRREALQDMGLYVVRNTDIGD